MGSEGKTRSPVWGILSRVVECLERKRWLLVLVTTTVSAVIFSILMKLTFVLLFGNGIAVLWPLVGIVSAVLMRLPRRYWFWVMLGTVLGHIYEERDYPFDELIVDTVCDAAEILIAVFGLPQFTNLTEWLRKRDLFVRFIAFPMTLGPMFTSIPVGIIFARQRHTGFWIEAAHWCFADVVSTVLWLPLSLILTCPETYELFQWRSLPRTIGLLGLTAGVCLAIFGHRPLPISFMVMPVLLLVAVKLGFSASVLSVNMLSIVGAVATLHGTGPFTFVHGEYRTIVLQAYLVLCMLSCFPVSIMMMDRDALEQELREACDGMEKLATRDGLTGLANRRRFDHMLAMEWSRAIRERRTIGLLMIDVDCFKMFNDCYGHLAGDQCLQRVATVLAAEAYRATDLAGRYGGEEFFVLMPGTDLAGVLMVGERIRRAIESLGIKHERSPYRIVTISVGCYTTVPSASRSAQELVEEADKALYSAKKDGRNRVEAPEVAGAVARVMAAGG